jgi:hypothetical protein
LTPLPPINIECTSGLPDYIVCSDVATVLGIKNALLMGTHLVTRRHFKLCECGTRPVVVVSTASLMAYLLMSQKVEA